MQLDGKIDAIGCSASSGASLLGRHGSRPSGKWCSSRDYLWSIPSGSEKYFDIDGGRKEAEYGHFRASDSKRHIAEAIGLKKWVTEEQIVETMVKAGYPDRIYCVSDEEARDMANRLYQEEGIFCGMPSGANVAVALKIAKLLGPGKNAVTTIVDRRDRYLSETPYEKYVA